MSNPVQFGSNGDPFRGGSFTPGTVPNLNGSIAPASTGSSLQGSVTAGQPLLARNDRGSNITIPYARVVLHPGGKTALPPTPYESEEAKAFDSATPTTLGRPAENNIIETESLFAGRVAFILGRRGKNYDESVRRVTGVGDRNANVPFRTGERLAQFAMGGSDINTMQRMCSFEYLRRYFYFVLRTKTMVLGAAADADFPQDAPFNSHVYKVKGAVTGSMTNVDGKTILDAIETRSRGAAAAASAPLQRSGIFLADDGPFLRGKTLESTLYKIGANRAPVPAAIGDIVAFDRLQQLIAETGACDWMPDGIVHSKLSQGDKMLDEELDSRDGQLFNVTVGGPAIATSWTGDRRLEVLPLDKVFVVIVADVWDDETKATIDNYHGSGTPDWTYEHELLGAAAGNAVRDDAEKKDYFENINSNTGNAENKKAVITNMRVRLTTSSEMVSCSALKPGKSKFPAQGANEGKSKSAYYMMERDHTSRMGLNISGNGGVSEYIIGGWCIGTVLDAAAARSSHEGATLVGSVKRQRASHASNVKVGVEWWSADRMYRSFMNVKGGLRTRYTGVSNNNAVLKSGDESKFLAKALKRV